MKRQTAIITIISLGLMLILGCTLLYKSNHKTVTTSTTELSKLSKLSELEPVKISKGTFNIMIDPRIELLLSVQLNSNYEPLTTIDFKYKDDVKNYFSKYKNHNAINTFKKLSRSGFSYDAPPATMMYVSKVPKLEQQTPFSDYLIGRGGSKKSLENFMLTLSNYAVESDFSTFYNNHMEFYKDLVGNVSKQLQDRDFAKELENYYGLKKNSYNLVISPLFHSGGYGAEIKTKNNNSDIYGFLGPHNSKDSMPIYSKEALSGIGWHEFSHSFVNPTTEKNITKVNKYDSLFTPLADIMSKKAYPNWEVCVNEHIVRAVTTRLSYIYLGKQAGDNALRYEKTNGFYYIDGLCAKLEYYEKNRDKYASFEDFYPELINVFKNYSEQNLTDDFYTLKFQGPINSAFNNKNIVFIVPTNENDKAYNDSILKDVENVNDTFKLSATIITDKKALTQDLSKNTILAYGTIEGNLWLSKYKSSFPFKIEDDKIKTDVEYNGTNLKLITALPNPQNSNNALIIYTAQNPEYIININEILHGGTDYVIAKKSEIIKSGNYIKDKNKWSFK
ncbi:MAG: DUF4932 domain-containing protein [Clostridium sp.]|uniref:DUF4932 domain-containing protein n=1 Tax=Clostridium sp. TaxID=1506 RepID=UPI003D6C8071